MNERDARRCKLIKTNKRRGFDKLKEKKGLVKRGGRVMKEDG
jgi:hypothetical protein